MLRRMTMNLNDLCDNEGATHSRNRVGRGAKGQSFRLGVALNGFEGGQMPFYRRLPKCGFDNIFA